MPGILVLSVFPVHFHVLGQGPRRRFPSEPFAAHVAIHVEAPVVLVHFKALIS